MISFMIIQLQCNDLYHRLQVVALSIASDCTSSQSSLSRCFAFSCSLRSVPHDYSAWLMTLLCSSCPPRIIPHQVNLILALHLMSKVLIYCQLRLPSAFCTLLTYMFVPRLLGVVYNYPPTTTACRSPSSHCCPSRMNQAIAKLVWHQPEESTCLLRWGINAPPDVV